MHKRLFRSLHISPLSEPSFDSVLEDSTHIADSLDPESLELLYESSFGASISVCQVLVAFPVRIPNSTHFGRGTLLFGLLGRFHFDMGHPDLKLG